MKAWTLSKIWQGFMRQEWAEPCQSGGWVLLHTQAWVEEGGIIRSCNRFNKKRRIGTPKTSSSNIIAKRRKYEWIKLVRNPEKASICAQSAANLSDWMTIRIRFRRAPNVRIRLIPKLGKGQYLGSPCSILFPSSGAVARAGGIVVLHTFVKN